MKTLKTFVVALIAFAVASCSSKPQLTHMPAKADGDSDWGLIDANGEFLVSDEFERCPSPVVNGYFFAVEKDGIAVYRAEKSLPVVGDLIELKDCGYYNDGLMPIVREGEHITFVDGDGKTKFVLEEYNGVAIKRVMGMYINGLCTFCTADGKWGAIDTNGNVVIEPQYSDEVVFLCDVALVRDADTKETSIIDRNGNIVKEFSENMHTSAFICGFAAVKIIGDEDDNDDDRYAMLTTKGDMIKLPSTVKDIVSWNEKYIIYENGDYDCGVMNYDGDILVRAKYDYLELLPNGQLLGERDDKYMFVKEDGETERLSFDEVAPAIRYPNTFSRIFDFKFELISLDKDGDEEMIYLRNYASEKIGKTLGEFRNRMELESVRSDYYDYKSVTSAILNLFDSNGLKGYPFGNMIGNYADTAKSKSWYRGDYSISVTPENDSPYYSISSAKLNSNNTVVYDATPYASYYTWEFNPQARVNSVTVKLSFNYENYRDDLYTHVAEALGKKYGTTIGTESGYNNYVIADGYNEITIHLDESALSGTTTVVEVCDSAVVEVCDSVAMAPVDTVAW